MRCQLVERVAVRARIFWANTNTGARGVYEDDYPSVYKETYMQDDGTFFTDYSFFVWEEGNYSCDCNRAILFEGYSMDSVECGDRLYQIVMMEVV